MSRANPFRDSYMRSQYDAAMRAYQLKHRDLFTNGSRRTPGGYGSSFAQCFWNGFDGVTAGVWNYAGDAPSRRTIGYAFYRAGMACAAAAREVQS